MSRSKSIIRNFTIMANEKCISLCIAELEKTVKKLTIKVAELEGEEDDFKVGNCVQLKDQNDDRMLEVTRVTSKSMLVRHGDNKAFLKRKDKVEKIELNK